MDYLRKWIFGIAAGWAIVGTVSAYVYFGGPLPSTDQYVAHKFQKRLELIEHLKKLDEELPALAEQRKQKREKWRRIWEEELHKSQNTQ